MPRLKLLVLVTAACLASAPAASAAAAAVCPEAPLPGARQILGQRHIDFVLFGEAHGTNELPAFFADLICVALEGDGSVTVGLELLPENQCLLLGRLEKTAADS